jgi:hypothetical protein
MVLYGFMWFNMFNMMVYHGFIWLFIWILMGYYWDSNDGISWNIGLPSGVIMAVGLLGTPSKQEIPNHVGQSSRHGEFSHVTYFPER